MTASPKLAKAQKSGLGGGIQYKSRSSREPRRDDELVMNSPMRISICSGCGIGKGRRLLVPCGQPHGRKGGGWDRAHTRMPTTIGGCICGQLKMEKQACIATAVLLESPRRDNRRMGSRAFTGFVCSQASEDFALGRRASARAVGCLTRGFFDSSVH